MSDACWSCEYAFPRGGLDAEGRCRQCRDECTIAELTIRLREALRQRDSARFIADKRYSLRTELADLLGVADLAGDEQMQAAIEAITRLKRLNGRRERHILRSRLQDAGAPVTPEWLGDVERIYPEARVTQRLCAALRRAWDERDKARAAKIRVDALADRWEGLGPTICGEMVDLAAVIRAAISEDVPHGR